MSARLFGPGLVVLSWDSCTVMQCACKQCCTVVCFGLLAPAEPCYSVVKVAKAADILASSSVSGNIMIFAEAQNCSGDFKGLGCAEQNMMNSSRKYK